VVKPDRARAFYLRQVYRFSRDLGGDEREGVTTVRVTHSGLTSEYLRSRNSGWPVVVKLLAGYAEQQS
jgi:hypothetical protein